MVAVLGLALAASALAGGPINPVPGDKQLGKAGGISYVSDNERTTDLDYGVGYAGCPKPGHKSRLTGGGFSLGASIPQANHSQPQDLYTSLGDPDDDPDDYWRTEVLASDSGAKFTTYAICAKFKALTYREVQVPDSLLDPTTSIEDCPGRSIPVGGGGSSGSDGAPITSMYPNRASWTFVMDGTVNSSTFAYNDFICFSPKGIRVETKSTKVNSLSSQKVDAKCSGGRHVLGGGVEVGFPSAAIAFASFPIDDGDKDKVPDDGWRAGAQSTSTQKQKLTSYAICKG